MLRIHFTAEDLARTRVAATIGAAAETYYSLEMPWQRHRHTRSERFPRLHVVLAGKEEHLLGNRRQALTAAVHGIASRYG